MAGRLWIDKYTEAVALYYIGEWVQILAFSKPHSLAGSVQSFLINIWFFECCLWKRSEQRMGGRTIFEARDMEQFKLVLHKIRIACTQITQLPLWYLNGIQKKKKRKRTGNKIEAFLQARTANFINSLYEYYKRAWPQKVIKMVHYRKKKHITG